LPRVFHLLKNAAENAFDKIILHSKSKTTQDASIETLNRLLQQMGRLDRSLTVKNLFSENDHSRLSSSNFTTVPLLPRLRFLVVAFLQGLLLLRFWTLRRERVAQRKIDGVQRRKRRVDASGSMWFRD